MPNIIIMGPPGSGKGTQSAIICKRYPHFNYLCMGQILREKYSLHNDNLKSGKLFHHELANAALVEFCRKYGTNNILMDGFPRDIIQVNKMIELGIRVHQVIVLELPYEVLVERIGGRLIHPASGRTYHSIFHPPKREGLDDLTGDVLVRRPEDHKEALDLRLSIYRENKDQILEALTNPDKLHNMKFHAIPPVERISCLDKDKDTIAFEIIRSIESNL